MKVDAKVCGLINYADFCGGDLKSESAQDYDEAEELALSHNWSSRWAFQWWAPHRRFYHKPAFKGHAKWTSQHANVKAENCHLFVFGKNTGVVSRDLEKTLIYLEHVDAKAGDDEIIFD